MICTDALERVRTKAMANLNFQQPPRSLANQGLSRGGFGSGGVTPTSGMFPSGGGGQQQPSGGQGGGGGGGGGSAFAPQQLSPSRSLPTMAPPNRNLFAQRTFPERRQVPTLASQSLGLQEWNSSTMSSMASFAMGPTSRSFGSQGLSNFHSSVFGGGGGSGGGGGPPDSSTPLLLDPSEFPSLTNRGQQDSMPQPSTMPGKQPYVGMVKQPTSESSEFTMSSEDFPALPGTGSEGSGGSGGSGVVGPSVAVGGVVGSGGGAGSDKAGAAGSQDSSGGTGGGGQVGGVEGVGPSGCSGTTSSAGSITSAPSSTSVTSGSSQSSRAPGSDKHSLKRGIQTSPDGKVTNIPNSMVKDQFGMVGLLTFIRAAETDPNLVSLALGQDLTALGLNLNSPDNLYPSFGGPWAEHPCRAQDIDYHVPPEYIINHNIRDKLAQLKLTRYKDDLLFFMYYTSVGDMLQLAAAAELYSRDWRYHMEEKVWITQAPGCSVIEKTSTYERGTYYFFDAQNWRKVAKEFYLDYSKLENQPTMPPYHTV